MARRWLAMAIAVAVAAVPLTVGVQTSASAYAGYLTTVVGITPVTAGVTASADANGEAITISNTTDTPLIVEGYQKEPYLKITNHGVWENELSPAVYLNKSLDIGNVPTDALPTATPKWKQLTNGHVMSYHDHRIHWMGSAFPPSVQADQHHKHLISNWSIPMTYGTQPLSITGTLEWYPSSNLGKWLPYVAIAAAVVIVVAVQLLVVRRRRNVSDKDAAVKVE